MKYLKKFEDIKVPIEVGDTILGGRFKNKKVKVKKIGRGKYSLLPQVITENAGNTTPEALAIQFRNLLETTIKENPDNYLWSHRRWKWSYQSEFENNWIDQIAPPIIKK